MGVGRGGGVVVVPDGEHDGHVDDGAASASPAAAPGSSGPGEQGYSGAATVGDEGAAAGAEAYSDPFGRPDSGDEPQ